MYTNRGAAERRRAQRQLFLFLLCLYTGLIHFSDYTLPTKMATRREETPVKIKMFSKYLLLLYPNMVKVKFLSMEEGPNLKKGLNHGWNVRLKPPDDRIFIFADATLCPVTYKVNSYEIH